MDARDALDQLVQVSDDIRAAVVFAHGGEPIAATVIDEEAAELARLGDAMLTYAGTLRGATAVRRLEALTPEGGVYLATDGERTAIAIAVPGSLVGLVQHDLGMLLRNLSRPRRRAKASAAS